MKYELKLCVLIRSTSFFKCIISTDMYFDKSYHESYVTQKHTLDKMWYRQLAVKEF
jgi:hypothetical protein